MSKKKKKTTHVPFRFNLLFFIVFLLFSVLILRLGVLQIVYGEDYKRQLQQTNDITVNHSVPRGKMFDRNGKVVVDNAPLNAIIYTKSQSTDSQTISKTANALSKLITMDTSKVHDRDKRDFWILNHQAQAKAKVTKKEWTSFNQKKLDNQQIYQLELNRITESELNSYYYDKKVDNTGKVTLVPNQNLTTLAIYSKMNSGYALTPQIIKNQNVTPEEFAAVSQNLDKLPGVDTTTDWQRSYPFGNTLQTVLGNVSSSDQGIPKDELDAYLAKGYSRNDRVGTSYLEQEYEDVLQGQKEQINDVTDQSGNVISTDVVSQGERGKDLQLAIDMDLQKQVENIIEQNLLIAKQYPNTQLLDRAFVVLMDPHTGDVLTMAGKQIVKDPKTGQMKFNDFALGTITTSYNVGSAVKGATVLTGYKTGAIHPGSTQLDEPLYIKGTPMKKSWKNYGLGVLTDLQALQVSSNVYMWKTVIAMAGGHYFPHQALPLNLKTFDTMRQSFAQFGLGVKTGIDLPNESAGFKGSERKPGLLLDLAIGQYDTYTTMQLAQYISTIANGGYRVQPHLVKDIREPEVDSNGMGPIIQEIQPNIVDKINMQDSWIQRVQLGFKMVTQYPGGTAYSIFKNVNYSPAGKTGTAQAFYDGPLRKQFIQTPEVMNLSFVSYAPSDNPQIAMAVLVPWVYTGNYGPSTVNELIGKQVFDAYFALQKQRQAQAQGGASAATKTAAGH